MDYPGVSVTLNKTKGYIMSDLNMSDLKPTVIDPRNIVSALNPRESEELELETIIPAIVAEDGVVLDPLTVFKFDPDHEIWNHTEDPVTGEPVTVPKEDRSKTFINGKGHRRSGAVNTVLRNPQLYPASVYENAKKVQAIVLEGISEERARAIARDAESIRGLKSWNVCKIVFEMLDSGMSLMQVIDEIPQMLFRAFVVRGEDEYDAVSKILDGSERKKAIETKLRNNVTVHIGYTYAIGGMLLARQLILHYKYNINKRKVTDDNRDEYDELVIIPKLDNIRKRLYPLYNAADAAKYKPLTRLEITEKAPAAGPNISFKPVPGNNGFMVVEGTCPEVREELLVLMGEKIDPKANSVPKVPSKAQNEEHLKQARSNVVKSNDCRVCGLDSEVEGKTHVQWDEWALGCQEREAIVNEDEFKKSLHPALQKLINVMTGERNADRIKEAFETVNQLIAKKG